MYFYGQAHKSLVKLSSSKYFVFNLWNDNITMDIMVINELRSLLLRAVVLC